MTFKISAVSFLTASLLTLAPIAAMADGAALAKDKCESCHGKNGNSTEEKVPSIAGFSTTSIEEAMEVYKSGDRKSDKFKPENGDESDMNKIAKDLSEADGTAIAEFYAAQKFKPRTQTAEAAEAAKGAKVHEKSCEKCHSDGGSNADDDSGILAGQWMTYLQTEFDKFSTDKRDMSKKMKKKFSKLNDAEKKALLHFYASAK